jgi:hypothetical protein
MSSNFSFTCSREKEFKKEGHYKFLDFSISRNLEQMQCFAQNSKIYAFAALFRKWAKITGAHKIQSFIYAYHIQISMRYGGYIFFSCTKRSYIHTFIVHTYLHGKMKFNWEKITLFAQEGNK